MKVTLPKGAMILDLPGAPAELVADTDVDIVVEMSDAEIAAGVEEYDVIAHDFVAAGRADLLPVLTHKSGDMTVAYSPSGNRVEQTAEEVEAAAADFPDPRVPPNVPPGPIPIIVPPKPKAKAKPVTIAKSAKTGKIVSKKFAKDNPDTTFATAGKKGSKKK